MSDSSPADEAFIHFTPRAPDSLNGADASTRRGQNGSARSHLPPEALGGWPEEPAPAATRNGARPSRERSRPPQAQSPARPRSETREPAASSGAVADRRDMRSAYQDDWLNAARKAGTPLELIFTNGTAVSGRLLNFDTFALVMEHEGGTALVFKHAVMLVRPQPPEGAAEGEGPEGGT